MSVPLDRPLDVPRPHRKTPHARQRLAPGPLQLRLIEQLGQIGIGVHDADEIRRRAHGFSVATESSDTTETLPRVPAGPIASTHTPGVVASGCAERSR
jgi:hypothetical protein